MIASRTILAPVLALLCASRICAQGDTLNLAIRNIDLSEFPVVQLKVEVTRNGALVRALDASQFRATENGVPQTILSLTCPGDSVTRFSVAILLDRSRSMTLKSPSDVLDPDSAKIRAAKLATSTFLDFLRPDDEAAVYSFSSNYFGVPFFTVNQNFTRDVGALKRSLVPIAASGGTWLWQAMMRTLDSLATRPGRRVMICLTDGRSTGENAFFYSSQRVIDRALQYRIPVYVIGLGSDIDEPSLQRIASTTNGQYYRSPDERDLEAIFRRIAAEVITNACILRYLSSNPCHDGTLRLVELGCSAGNAYAEDDTSYTIDRDLTRLQLFFEQGLEIDSRAQFRLPVFLGGAVTPGEPLSYAFTLTYDPSVFVIDSLVTAGTMSEGALPQLTIQAPGRARIAAAAFSPSVSSGPLVALDLTASPLSASTVTRVDIGEASLAQACPTDITTEGADISVLACQASYVLGNDVIVLPDKDGRIRVDLALDPPVPAGTPFRFHTTIVFDTTVMDYAGYQSGGTLGGDGRTVLTRVKNALVIDLDGTASAPRSAALTLEFAPRQMISAAKTVLSFSGAEFETDCRTQLDVVPVTIITDGICEHLIKRIPSSIAAYPNPATRSIVFTFSMKNPGPASVRLLDGSGRRVAVIADGTFSQGEHSITLATDGLPAGTYSALLETDGGAGMCTVVVVK